MLLKAGEGLKVPKLRKGFIAEPWWGSEGNVHERF